MPARYQYAKCKGHPLAPPSGRLPKHRLILFEKIGYGPVKCFWCPKIITWSRAASVTEDGVITTDHADGDTRNNDPDNLVPSCHTCNVRRARDVRFADGLFVINNQSGARERAEKRTCQTCGIEFLIAVKMLRSAEKRQKKNVGRYCSRDCLHNRNEFDHVEVLHG